MSEPARCPSCGYTKEDAALHGDHHLCKGTIPGTKQTVYRVSLAEINKLRADRDALLAAAESALQWMALNTPFPLDPNNPDPLFYAMADAMDKQRERLREAIKQAQAESLTAEEQSYRDLAASGGIVDAP